MENNELKHYGVVGMKWGVRKAKASARIALRRSAGAVTPERQKAFHEDYLRKQARADELEDEYRIAKAQQERSMRIAGAAIAAVAAVGIGVAIYNSKQNGNSTYSKGKSRAKSTVSRMKNTRVNSDGWEFFQGPGSKHTWTNPNPIWYDTPRSRNLLTGSNTALTVYKKRR